MNPDQLEAAIWQALTLHKATVTDAPALVRRLVRLADDYAAGDCEHVQARRRAVLERDA